MSFEPEAVRAFENAGWQRAAAAYEDNFAPATAPFIQPLLDAAEITAGSRVLDVACGPGHVAAVAAARGARAQGLDFSAAMVRVARAAHPDIAVTEGDAEALPYPDGAFDAIVSNFGLHHVPRPEVALGEASRVLAPGGHAAFTVWAAPEENVAWRLVFDAIARHGDRTASQAPPPGGSFNQPDDCLRALAAAGLRGHLGPNRAGRMAGREWARALIAALSAGTVRMAALIAAQDPAACRPSSPTSIARPGATAGASASLCRSPRSWRAGKA